MTPPESPAEPVSRRLAEVLAGVRFDALPPDVVDHAQRAVLDWLGSVLAGSLEPPARMAQRLVVALGVSDEATVFNAGQSSAAGAALANGVASHILELDDVHKGSTLHAAAPVISAALAVAEREHASGQAFLLAVVCGYEAALRVGEAVNPDHYRFWHPTGTAATFGAAAAAGSLMGLDAKQMLDALGSAGTQASGLWEFNADGAMSKHLHPGKAAFNGVLSADLAAEGFTGASRILEGERGFFRATSASSDGSRITDGLGSRWKIGENCYKMHSCCGHTHSAIDVVLDLGGAMDGVSIERITAQTYQSGFAIVKEMNPKTPYQAQFSLAYCMAAALAEGAVSLDQFSAERFGPSGVRDARIADLLSKTTITVADDLTAKYPAAWPTRIAIELSDGRTLTGSSDYPRGNPEHPVSTAVLGKKLRLLVSPRLGDATANAAIELARDLPRVSDMAEAVRALAGTCDPHTMQAR